jgi:hypothetical protein
LKSFSNEQVKTWIAQAVLAMMLIHSKNILHRDLKLQNMFLAKDNTLKLGDFGVARELEENIDFASTMCGTPYYMAPEVCRGRPYNSKADIFALGIALYEICTFELPFADETIPGLFDKILNQQPPPILGDYDDDCKALIFMMLSKDPDNRPSVTELFHTEFIHEKVTSWCLADPKIRAYVEGMVNVTKPMRAQKKAKLAKDKEVVSIRENPNYFCENPTILVAELMANLTIKNIKKSYWSEPVPVFSGIDMYNCLKLVKGFENVNEELIEQMCSFLMGRGILLRLDEEESWDIDAIYSFTFIKPVSPENMLFNYTGELKDTFGLGIKLLHQLNSVYEDLFGDNKKSSPDWDKIYTNVKFLNYLQDITMLQTCDIDLMNKKQKGAFFLNIKQCIWLHEYIVTKGLGPPIGL